MAPEDGGDLAWEGLGHLTTSEVGEILSAWLGFQSTIVMHLCRRSSAPTEP